MWQHLMAMGMEGPEQADHMAGIYYLGGCPHSKHDEEGKEFKKVKNIFFSEAEIKIELEEPIHDLNCSCNKFCAIFKILHAQYRYGRMDVS